MEQNYFTKHIEETYHSLTRAEKKVADYVLQNPRQVLFMSITDLADACQVGETSVYRFCRTMNLQGYQEFKMQLSLGMSEQDEEWTPEEDNQGLEKTLKESAERLLRKHVEALEETYRLLNQESFEGFLERMEKARRIFFFGISDSQLIAQEAGNKFMSISGKAYSVADTHMQAVTAASMTEEDFLIFLSYSGATKDNIYTARIARRTGAGIGCITRFRKSPLSAYCDEVLQSGANEGPMEGGSVSAKIGQMYLIDLLYQEYRRRNYETSRKYRENASKAVMDKLF